MIGTTEENLRTAFESEIKAKNEIYPPLIKEAIDCNRGDLRWSFSRSRDVEERHAKLYKDALSAMVTDKELQYHVCQVCGYVTDKRVPAKCPICGVTEEKFKTVDL